MEVHALEDLYEFEDSGAFIVRSCLRRGRRRRKGGGREECSFLGDFIAVEKKIPNST